MERTAASRRRAATLLAVARRLRDEIDDLFAKTPQVGGVLRAMPLGDRSFVERSESTDFQKTGVFHVLVVAGLHVGALAVFLFCIGRALRLARFWTALGTLTDNGETALRADVLKVGHHGSKNSTMPGFLAAVRPRVAVISAGEDNPYSHPNPELLEALTSAGMRFLRTDRDGAVQVLTDGKQLEISCFVACPEKTAGAASAHAQPPDQQQRHEQ
jgi:hypothetical protein